MTPDLKSDVVAGLCGMVDEAAGGGAGAGGGGSSGSRGGAGGVGSGHAGYGLVSDRRWRQRGAQVRLRTVQAVSRAAVGLVTAAAIYSTATKNRRRRLESDST